MKAFVLVLGACAASAAPPVVAPAAPKPDPALEPLAPLLGHWEGTDPDHHASGGFVLRADLGGKVLVRRSTNDSKAGHHEDMTLIYASPAGLRANYFDNEGHVISYAVTRSGD